MEEKQRRKKFKGVVQQKNGHWGAQIYGNQRRIWLGTFKTEEEAAMAYDSAAIRVRKGDSYRNLPWNNDLTLADQEPKFQSQFNTETLLNMIKDGSYFSKFADYLRISTEKPTNLEQYMDTTTYADCGGSKAFFCKKLFHKFLTPSDVSKLNRLVIPKKFAQLYFPRISNNDDAADGRVGDMEMMFFDKAMKSWKFKYLYWKSSQSYVFTRGWNRFVKAKGLKAKDKVIFSLCKCSGRLCRRGGGGGSGRQHPILPLNMIDVVRHRDQNGDEVVAEKNTYSSSPSKHPLKTNSKSNGVLMLFGVPIMRS